MLALGIMPWTRYPANAMLVVKFLALPGFLGSENLHWEMSVGPILRTGAALTSVVVDEDIGTSSLKLVCRNGLLERPNGGLNDTA